jgi:redox-sensitive bicupin YhaK (pirin superfamily)
VRPHPHINLATVTYLYAGAIDHRDSLGTFATIEPGAVNLMTAGSGIVHSERSPSAERARGPELSGIQTWLALPEAMRKWTPPSSMSPRPTCRSSRTWARTAR